MSEEPSRPAPAPLSLPDHPDIDWLRKQAKRRLDELRQAKPAAQLRGDPVLCGFSPERPGAPARWLRYARVWAVLFL